MVTAPKNTVSSAAEESESHLDRFSHNMAQVAQQWQEIMSVSWEKTQESNPMWMAGQHDLTQIATSLYMDFFNHPEKLFRQQVEFYERYMSFVTELCGIAPHAPEQAILPSLRPDKKDRRFHDMAWESQPFYYYVRGIYLLISQYLLRLPEEVSDMDQDMRHKMDFYLRQLTDAIAPTNFTLTNPEAMRKIIQTDGASLVQGLSNLLSDLKRQQGVFSVSMTDEKAFTVGKDIAATAGKVVYRNELIELIQYSATTDQVHQTPLLIVPPWINKYYVLDLRPKNSFVKWLVDQGHTVFIISWVNPGAELADTSFADYMKKGLLAALTQVQKHTGEKRANVMGYCIGGTLLATALAYLKARREDHAVRSATYLTTLVDFEESGDLRLFTDAAHIEQIEVVVKERGYMRGSEIAQVFNLLRSRELIWSFVVNHYLLGNAPFPFDLLYWNADSTNLPGNMHLFYLRHMYEENKLVVPGGIMVEDVPIDLSAITTPSYFLSTREDHIAPWKATYKATQLYKGDRRFVLSGSGHIAGVVNPPAANKYGYWVNPSCPARAAQWFKNAEYCEGSWWNDWKQWVVGSGHTGGKTPARRIVGKVLADAPGTYIHQKAS